LKELDAEIAHVIGPKGDAVTDYDIEKTAHLRDQADKLKKQLERMKREWREKRQTTPVVVDQGTVAEVIAKMTGSLGPL